MNVRAAPALLSNRGALLLKVYAVSVMVLGHADQVFFDSAAGLHMTIGRTVFPVFAFLLAYNLARTTPDRMLSRLAPRMAAVGLLSMVPYVYLFGWVGLNVLFTVALAAVVVGLWAQGQGGIALALFVLAGGFVDYGWLGVAAIAGGWWCFRQDREQAALWLPVAIPLALWPVNGNLWALAAGPLLWMACNVTGDAPRFKWLFYAFYPAHLVLLAAVAYVR